MGEVEESSLACCSAWRRVPGWLGLHLCPCRKSLGGKTLYSCLGFLGADLETRCKELFSGVTLGNLAGEWGLLVREGGPGVQESSGATAQHWHCQEELQHYLASHYVLTQKDGDCHQLRDREIEAL